ncbi:MAG TPA: phage GP46 family protein [Gammaproteobacteria bacterium]|nr:phage GP46 family protein [Gammaproteobacteria bacterium]
MIFLDSAITYDPAARRCDLVFDGQDFALDAGPVTAVLTAVGIDARARADDVLPTVASNSYSPASLIARRGWSGDALDPSGERSGCRKWVVEGRKQTEPTRQAMQDALAEVLQKLADGRGWPMTLAVDWVRWNFLGYRIAVGDTSIKLNQAVS